MLQLKDVVKDYPTATTTVHALRKVSLNFRESEFVAILGPSGCGKTTMLNIIGGLDRYTSGDLVIGGVSTRDFDDEHWDAYRNATIGFVFQSYNLIPHLTVLENVELALSLVGENKKTRRAKAVAALHKVNMHEEIHKRPNQLSGGQMQRVAIARAIVNDPKIILADEPTGALDSELSVQVMDILQDISKTRLVIMVTHNAELAYQYATRICRFKDGQLIEDTNPYNPEEETAKDKAQDNQEAIIADDTADIEIAQNTTIDTSTLQNDEVNVENVQKEEEGKSKKLSNHKRKLAMKRVGSASNAIFDKLGINSLSKKKKHKDRSFKPTSMSAGMAFGLSLRNLVSKKRRTFFTMFAGSIGIIGLGLVLSISNGFNVYVEKMEKEMFSSVPLGIYQYNVQNSAIMDMMMNFQNKDDPGAFPDSDKIGVNTDGGGSIDSYISSFTKPFLEGITKNVITEEFTQYMKDMPKDNYKSMSINYGLRYNLVRKTYDTNGNVTYADVSQAPEPITALAIATTVLGENGLQSKYWQELASDKDTMLESYDLIGKNSRYPQNKNEILLCVGKDNKVSQELLNEFGIELYKKNDDGTPQPVDGKPVPLGTSDISYEYFIGQSVKMILNDDYYIKTGENSYDPMGFDKNPSLLYWSVKDQSRLQSLYENSETELKIVGVIRQKKGGYSFVNSALCYTPELAEWAMDQAYDSEVARIQRTLTPQGSTIFGTYAEINNSGFTDDNFSSELSGIVGQKVLTLDYFAKAVGADRAASFITVFPETFEQKDAAVKYIEAWDKTDIGYFDVSAMFLYNITIMIDLVSAMLIAVASISLVVSTVMIGVITSNSVIERIREIGILRAIGARKRDIRNVFIAETAIIGFSSGVIGILVTYILCPLISLIIKAVTGIGSLLHFHPLHALALVAISLLLTVISGIIPAISASRKNVVDALRVE